MKQIYPPATKMATIVLVCLLVPAVGGCQPGAPTASDQADKQAAEAKLAGMLVSKQQAAQQEAQLAAQQEAARQAAARQQAVPAYPPDELASAARPRKWATITVPDLNVKAVFNSTWTDGNLNYRIALLGQKAMIANFLAQWRKYKINFADQAGNNIYAFEVSPSDFRWQADDFNGGIPTMDTQGAVPCELPIYEQSVQWNLTWEG